MRLETLPHKRAQRILRWARGKIRQSDRLEFVEGAALDLVTTTLAGVFPVHLNEPIVRAEGLIVGAMAQGSMQGPELPSALVCIFSS